MSFVKGTGDRLFGNGVGAKQLGHIHLFVSVSSYINDCMRHTVSIIQTGKISVFAKTDLIFAIKVTTITDFG